MCKKLDTFQLRAIRQILHIQTTFVNKENTNQRVYEMAEAAAGKPLTKLSEKYKHKAIKYMGHLIREADTEPTKQVTFYGSTLLPHYWGQTRRVGGPKQQWIEETIKACFSITLQHLGRPPENYTATVGQQRWIIQAAQERAF
jgi:hypothetical protein